MCALKIYKDYFPVTLSDRMSSTPKNSNGITDLVFQEHVFSVVVFGEPAKIMWDRNAIILFNVGSELDHYIVIRTKFLSQ